jgi:hypothetical protein
LIILIILGEGYVYVMKFLIMHFSPTPCQFISPRSKYFLSPLLSNVSLCIS